MIQPIILCFLTSFTKIGLSGVEVKSLHAAGRSVVQIVDMKSVELLGPFHLTFKLLKFLKS